MRLTLITEIVWGCALDLDCHHLIEGVLERQTYFEISRPIYTEGPAGWQGTHPDPEMWQEWNLLRKKGFGLANMQSLFIWD